MYEDEKAKWRQECEENGISWARAALPNRQAGIQEHIRQWIDEYERREQGEREDAQARMSEEAIAAAKLSAETSRDAAIASKKSAWWTMWAAIAAALSAIISLVEALGWLPNK